MKVYVTKKPGECMDCPCFNSEEMCCRLNGEEGDFFIDKNLGEDNCPLEIIGKGEEQELFYLEKSPAECFDCPFFNCGECGLEYTDNYFDSEDVECAIKLISELEEEV